MLLKAKKLLDEAISIRRDLHKYPELAFLEYRTASKIINYLLDLGYDVKYGKDVADSKYITDIPSLDKQESCIKQAILDGANEYFIDNMKNGLTGVVAQINTNKPGKTIAFRFDMDALEICETDDNNHIPNKLNFSSTYKNVMHACGHDGHVAIGLCLAKLIKENLNMFSGKFIFIFQPAEEGVRGANSMVKANIVNDVDYFFSGHIGIQATNNDSLVCYSKNFLATSRFNVDFKGVSSHAALAPEKGKNALLASCSATLALYSIVQHGQGASRVNVGILNAGRTHNAVAGNANMVFQVRGETNQINSDLEDKSLNIINHAAKMYDVDVNIKKLGYAKAITFNDAFANELNDYLSTLNIYENVIKDMDMNASEDVTLFMEHVINNGGQASYLMFGSNITSTHHSENFDFDEIVLYKAIATLASLAYKYCK